MNWSEPSARVAAAKRFPDAAVGLLQVVAIVTCNSQPNLIAGGITPFGTRPFRVNCARIYRLRRKRNRVSPDEQSNGSSVSPASAR